MHTGVFQLLRIQRQPCLYQMQPHNDQKTEKRKPQNAGCVFFRMHLLFFIDSHHTVQQLLQRCKNPHESYTLPVINLVDITAKRISDGKQCHDINDILQNQCAVHMDSPLNSM